MKRKGLANNRELSFLFTCIESLVSSLPLVSSLSTKKELTIVLLSRHANHCLHQITTIPTLVTEQWHNELFKEGHCLAYTTIVVANEGIGRTGCIGE